VIVSFNLRYNTSNFFVNISNIPLDERILDFFTDDELDSYLVNKYLEEESELNFDWAY
jgi:hypothetical protein